MAMDKTTTRRMIGAIVLVLVAALVLAYLLKSKNSQPEIEKVQDVTLPSSPILEFPGDGSANDTTAANQDAGQKVGLDVRPDGLKPAGDAVSDAAQAQQAGNGLKAVNASGSQGSSTQNGNNTQHSSKASADKSKPKSDRKLKDADVLSLDNGSKVSSGKDKSSNSKDKKEQKKSSSKPKLVGEKKLPKYSDKHKKLPKKDMPKKKESKADVSTVAADSVPTTGYSIQLMATGSESKAKAVKKQMVDEGYPAYVTSVIKNGKTLHRVRIGSYQDKAEAGSVQDRMKRRYTKNSSVQNSLVVAN